jgi:hypothetical protein
MSAGALRKKKPRMYMRGSVAAVEDSYFNSSNVPTGGSLPTSGFA